MSSRTESVPARRRLPVLVMIVAILVFYLLPQFVSLFIFGGAAIDEGFSTVRGVLASEVVTDLGAALLAVALILWLRWGAVVWRESVPTRRWVWVVPAALVVLSLLGVDVGRLASVGPTLVLCLLAATFCVGLFEELMFRGIALRSLRDKTPELAAAIISSVLFGSPHLANALISGAGAIPQAVVAMFAGYLFYLIRRVSGGILVPILVHWVYDFSVFSAYLGPAPVADTGGAAVALLLGEIVLVIVVIVGHRWIAPRNSRPEIPARTH